MKKNGILNSGIAKVLDDMGHTDTIVIADMGLPVPDGVKKIDLALLPGVPAFSEVLKVLMDEMQVEKITLAEEIKSENEGQLEKVKLLCGADMPCSYIPHEQFKVCTKEAKAIIRTGENTPYSNIILQSGVIF